MGKLTGRELHPHLRRLRGSRFSSDNPQSAAREGKKWCFTVKRPASVSKEILSLGVVGQESNLRSRVQR